MRNLWERPQIHVLFREYTVSFTIKDINRALELLNETGEHKYGARCELDTSGNYSVELFEGTKMEYKNELQPLLQNAVGCFLFRSGRAEVYYTTKKHKKKFLTSILVDIESDENVENSVFIQVYDPKNRKLIFSGKMATAMFNQDLGIDYY